MKIRRGFVSNSSSSSFVCDICHESYEGYDGQYDTDVVYCNAGHEICGDCITSIKPDTKALSANIEKAIEKLNLCDADANELMGVEDKVRWIEEYVMIDGELDSSICPVCNLTHITAGLEAQYLLEKFGQERSDIHREIRETFGNLKGWEKRNES